MNAPAVVPITEVRTKPKRHHPFLARHPWVHAHALADPAQAGLQVGQTVDLVDAGGQWVAAGLVNPASRLRVRLYSFSRDESIDDAMWVRRIESAVARRRLTHSGDPAGGERLIFSESDLLSGLIVDRYADCLSIQLTAAALIPRANVLINAAVAAVAKYGTPCTRWVVRMDDATAKHEGVDEETRNTLSSLSHGWEGHSEHEPTWYRHNGLEMAVDLRSGQKTGGYLDQQANQAAAAGYLKGRRVLDVCCYTGGFSLAAARAGANEVIGIDSSEKALQQARGNAERNHFPQVSWEAGDCFESLKARGERGESFDAVILDPPRFAGSRHQIDAAMRAYGRLNTLAVDLLSPGGILISCSCSGRVSTSDFLNMLLDVARRRGRDMIILETRGAAPDHPVGVSCPESHYLKCVIAQVM